MKKDIAFLPGVREHDIPALPPKVKVALVAHLQELAAGNEFSARLTGALAGCRKVYFGSPEGARRQEENPLIWTALSFLALFHLFRIFRPAI